MRQSHSALLMTRRSRKFMSVRRLPVKLCGGCASNATDGISDATRLSRWVLLLGLLPPNLLESRAHSLRCVHSTLEELLEEEISHRGCLVWKKFSKDAFPGGKRSFLMWMGLSKVLPRTE